MDDKLPDHPTIADIESMCADVREAIENVSATCGENRQLRAEMNQLRLQLRERRAEARRHRRYLNPHLRVGRGRFSISARLPVSTTIRRRRAGVLQALL